MHHICLEVSNNQQQCGPGKIEYFLCANSLFPVLQVDDINKAIKDLEGKIRPLNPEPQVWLHGKVAYFGANNGTFWITKIRPQMPHWYKEYSRDTNANHATSGTRAVHIMLA